MTQTATAQEIIEHYDIILLDSCGVLVAGNKAIKGAQWFIEQLNCLKKRYLVLTNDASKSLARMSERYHGLGLEIPPEKILNSGLLLADYFREHNLGGAPCVVIGTEDSRRYVKAAGGEIVSLEDITDEMVFVLCDDEEERILEKISAVFDVINRLVEKGKPPHLILVNPDVIYPTSPHTFEFGPGAFASLMEHTLRVRFPGPLPLEFARLGKPYLPIFQKAREITGEGAMIMIGDQLETDIKGAIEFGIDSALVLSGVNRWGHSLSQPELSPSYLMKSLSLV